MPFLTSDSEIPEKGKGSKLTGKMKLFVNEYFIDLNATAAVLRAGYKTRDPSKIAVRLMKHPLVKREVETRFEEKKDKADLSAEYVIQKLIDIVEKTENGNPQAALRGLELLGKHLGLYRDKQEISGPDGEAIKYEKVKEDADDFTRSIARLAERAGKTGVAEVTDTGTAG
jgi:phage terminase small subunit